ncbi:hypothetical protein BBC27_08100 [Acidithiobacillus ferrivorans]|uniref:Uncharacterized protein n=1 Tax=Acidithiobacillus ferrivorans TaxID=160808 RepID=A0A1B9C0D5_9PROT|nr:hypothetical protein [Acidithiobacillus ferrivorans]OCB03418.1 hypothetical protein BBC27_08100 [Acidithiobacillus ferrivorans]
MDKGLDMLGGDDANASDAGETPPMATGTATDVLLEGKSHELQMKIVRAISARKLDENDPLLDAYNCTGMAAEAAAAAGAAAQAVQAGVQKIPDQIWDGAIRAGGEVKGELVQGAKLFVEAFVAAAGKQQTALVAAGSTQQADILAAAQVGADKIKLAATTLTASLDKAVAAKTEQGVSDFARAAAVAGKAAAQSSMAAQLSRSAMTMIVAFLFAVMIGAGGLWGWLLITHRVMPAGVVAMQDPLRGGDLLIVPTGGKPIPGSQCPGGLCLIYKSGIPDLP